MKRYVALVVALVMCMSLGIIGVGGASDGSDVKRVAFICKGYSDMFCLKVMEQVELAAPDYADQFTIEYFDGEMDATKHNNLIETCVANGFDAIIFQQIDAEAPVAVVKDALDAGVFVCVTTGHIEDGGASWYVDADPYQQGEAAAQYAIERGDCTNAQVAILRGMAGNFHAEQRLAAFEHYLSEVEGCEIVAAEVADWSKDKAMTITQNWLVSYPDLKVIFGSCDDMSMGAVEAIQMAGMQDQVKVFSIDGTDVGIKAVKEGQIMCTVQQDAKGYAIEALEIISKLLKGEEAESVNIDSPLISAENVDEYL